MTCVKVSGASWNVWIGRRERALEVPCEGKDLFVVVCKIIEKKDQKFEIFTNGRSVFMRCEILHDR